MKTCWQGKVVALTRKGEEADLAKGVRRIPGPAIKENTYPSHSQGEDKV